MKMCKCKVRVNIQVISRKLHWVKLWDERNTTVSAHSYLNTTNTRGKKRKAVVDAVAAVIILESYLGYRKNSGLT